MCEGARNEPTVEMRKKGGSEGGEIVLIDGKGRTRLDLRVAPACLLWHVLV